MTGSPNYAVQAVDTSGNIVDAFTGTASGTSGVANQIVRFVDNSGMVCLGTSVSATAAAYQTTARVCNSSHQVAPCSESSTPASYNLSVDIIDANGFIDDTY